ncbi:MULTISPECIES: helix-turn-helix domain-containing protein [unclassified Leucobacter]|uniref:helix-turn-helix domain-containing protein n=1 Tax=unclassified Leucobacter TaxID=2621730 RepID=UPI00165D4A17|nr:MULTISPECIES: helix-turn-helix domain-containing protein [unclassified Leucobacter]MBC9937086.1 helix-turn-helix domain-containing protein [Leucobacter sp. cx-87]
MRSPLRVRQLRQAKGMKANELAAAAGISAPMLSQVERGLVDPSLETLRQVARVLSVPLFELFVTEVDEEQVHVMRSGDETTLTTPSGDMSYRRKSTVGKQLEVLLGELRPGGASRETVWSHEAEECVVVTRGQLVIETNRGRTELAEGDSCHFDSRIPHRFLNETEATTEFIISVTPPSH